MIKTTGKKFTLVLLFAALMFSCESPETTQLAWPEVTHETKPWTRWWWQGSAVNKQDLTAELESFKEAGIGGVEITPIYGVYGFEDQFKEYLSEEWVEMLVHTLQEGERLDVGIDMATGTGWPFGGPWIDQENAPKYLAHKTYELKGGESLREKIAYRQEPFVRAVGNQIYEMHDLYSVQGQQTQGTLKEPLLRPAGERIEIDDLVLPVSANENLQALALDQVRFDQPLPFLALTAVSAEGQKMVLTDRVAEDGTLDWTAPEGSWTLYAVFQGWHGKMVERAAPGGEGNVIDHFSREALGVYLDRFDSALADADIGSLRSFFNDSYEVDDARGNADWTPQFFEEFQTRRGYDLVEYLPELLSQDSSETHLRVLCDFRETISDLLLENFTLEWREWANGKNAMIRNQAHGSPANIIDLYAASDIPETEGSEIFMYKLASSASHLTGKKFTSAEAATWLDEHFLSGWSDVKQAVDRFFLGGVNHIVYHGSAYSPDQEAYPGWLFYAAVHFNDRNPQWKDFHALNNYITRAQSFLQAGIPGNDVLLYYPIYDRFSQPDRASLEHFHELTDDFEGHPIVHTAEALQERGYAYDYLTDRLLQDLSFENGAIRAANSEYRTIVIPGAQRMSVKTLEKLMELARQGASVIFYENLPNDVPGLHELQTRRQSLQEIIDGIAFSGEGGLQRAEVDNGLVLKGDDLEQMLSETDVYRESMTDLGLKFVRRKYEGGEYYYLLNESKSTVDSWIPLQSEAGSAAIFDPMSGRSGIARVRVSGNAPLEVYGQLEPGQSLIIQTSRGAFSGASFPYYEATGEPLRLEGTWAVEFISGGPVLPDPVEMDQLQSWSELEGDSARHFSGTAKYTIEFPRPSEEPRGWVLDLGKVAETAEVRLNGETIGTLIGPGYKLYLEEVKLLDHNTLEIQVSNLMANRMAWLDKNGVFWKKFYNINFPARLAENRNDLGLFSAADWEPRESGLLGPVVLTPVNVKEVE